MYREIEFDLPAVSDRLPEIEFDLPEAPNRCLTI